MQNYEFTEVWSLTCENKLQDVKHEPRSVKYEGKHMNSEASNMTGEFQLLTNSEFWGEKYED